MVYIQIDFDNDHAFVESLYVTIYVNWYNIYLDHLIELKILDYFPDLLLVYELQYYLNIDNHVHNDMKKII